MKTHMLSSARLMSESCNKELNPQFMSWGFTNKKKIEIKPARQLRCAQVSHFPKFFFFQTSAVLICSMILNICLGQNFTDRLRFCVGKANILVNSRPCSQLICWPV